MFGGTNAGTGVPAGFISGGMGNNITTWCSVRIGSSDNDTCNGNENDLDLTLVPGTLSGLKASVSVAPGVNANGTNRIWTVTLRRNGVALGASPSTADTVQTCQIIGTATTCTTAGAAVTIDNDDLVVVQVQGNSNQIPQARFSFALIFVPA